MPTRSQPKSRTSTRRPAALPQPPATLPLGVPGFAPMMRVAKELRSWADTVLGMAGGMILMAILVAVLPVATAMMLHGAVQSFSNGSRAWFLRRHVRWDILPWYAVGAAAASPSASPGLPGHGGQRPDHGTLHRRHPHLVP